MKLAENQTWLGSVSERMVLWFIQLNEFLVEDGLEEENPGRSGWELSIIKSHGGPNGIVLPVVGMKCQESSTDSEIVDGESAFTRVKLVVSAENLGEVVDPDSKGANMKGWLVHLLNGFGDGVQLVEEGALGECQSSAEHDFSTVNWETIPPQEQIEEEDVVVELPAEGSGGGEEVKQEPVHQLQEQLNFDWYIAIIV